MKYKNASEILPDKLLKEIQKYISGDVLYVPAEGKRKKWGSDTGARTYYEQRNEDIREKYFGQKMSIDQLCDEYNLSEETIKKIIYR